MRRVGIIDYGLCNIDSIARAVDINGGRATISCDPDVVRKQDLLLLPGVGAFDAAMEKLVAFGLADAIKEEVGRGTPLLGICLGMQLLARRSEEGTSCDGLGLIDGEVVRLERTNQQERIPHIGWNELIVLKDDPLLKGAFPADFYFVHSYHMRCRDEGDIVATTPFCGAFTSIVRHGIVAGTQFHPEKSWPAGHKLLANFIGTA